MSTPVRRPRFSRRHALQLAGAAGLTAAAAACTDTSDVSSDGPTARSSVGDFAIPDWSDAPKSASLRWVDSGDQKALYFKAFFDAFGKKFSGIDVDYKGTNWNTIQQSITLGLRNGTAPDVFQLPSTISTPVAVKEGWLRPLDDVVPGWPQIKDRLPTGLIANGVNVFDGKTYSLPITKPALGTIVLINADLAAQADVDTGQDFTLDSFGSAVRAATKKGAGKYYGLVDYLAQPNGMNAACSMIARLSGMVGGVDNNPEGSINYRTGELTYTDPILADVIDWYLGLQKDGCFLPGSVSLDAPGARERFPQGQSAFIFQGPWNIGLWGKEFPDLKLDVALAPVQEAGKVSPFNLLPGGGNNYCVAASSKSAEVAGKAFEYIFSDDGQTHWAYYAGSGDPAVFPTPSLKPKPLDAKVNGWMKQYGLLGPSPTVRNPDMIKVSQALVAPQPALHDVCTALFTGKATNIKKELKALQDRADKAIDTAIATAKKSGAKVSRDDYVFSDWDPTKPYVGLYK
ncbi:ABC transporter substrate-binding protein [Microlunatus soli]|uniref:Carbohydrate ABC transporter substrate-binding protein, CUT1 family n=1 Tax=Microlunatus soli TaxID=630515 RepID=A0A1H1UJP5_9ACTN|nr:extracellular solute-binding protein [Microlunatus soli]SDS72059.1 carbohydrate ABC transporter substrate-binding protein, CUT1 family [Microlunatus soli]